METWVSPGTKCIEKDSLKKHLTSTPHKEAIDLSQTEKSGSEKYTANAVEETPIGKGLKWMCTDDKKALFMKFNTAYLLAKKERPSSDYPDLLEF